MHLPAHIDGCSLVILKHVARRFTVEAAGFLSVDGEMLTLGENRRVITEDELRRIMDVAKDSHILETRGYQYFIINTDD